ncbi:MAG: methylmalonyl-CoA mutase family protein [Reichenbachiella sp.]|uniref:methylmalonyl-CoA mutase family protein n=1 Tax=Reichenbachiella sp. TaxID=2184521 RepID=UPI003265DD66
MIKEYNFDEFAIASRSQWRDKLNKDLGTDLADRISNWTSERNLKLSAYHDKEDVNLGMTVPEGVNRSWKYLQPIDLVDTKESVQDALMNGADGLLLNDVLIMSLDAVFEQVAPEHCTLAVTTSNVESYKKITTWCDQKIGTQNQSDFLLFYNNDKISSTVTTAHQNFMKEVFHIGSRKGHKVINLDCGLVQRNGGSVQLELSYLLTQSVYYINRLIDEGKDINSISNSLFISTSIGSNFFLELAKLRAMKILMTQVLQAYGIENFSLPIHAFTSSLSKSILDENTNFLRCTSEAMSAVLGGTDYLTIIPHHSLRFASRIARNISNLLKDESNLAKTEDPAAGSYYLENLTEKLAREVWKSFLDIEKKGGFEAAVSERFFEQEIEKDLEFQRARIASGKRKLVGVNDFGNESEQIPIDKHRRERVSLSQNFEEIRQQVEEYVLEYGEEKRPIAYLLGVGADAKMINARFTFATNFFNWSGIKVKKIDEAEKLGVTSIIICCGADDDYDEATVSPALLGLESSIMVLAAGKHNSAASGKISSWINTRTNRLEGVRSVLMEMGVIKKSSVL